MNASAEIVSAYLSTLDFIPERSRLELGKVEVSFHCDKFNTRILKNFEDVLGVEKGGDLLQKTAERTTYEALKKFLDSESVQSKFEALSHQDKAATLLEIFKIPAYGAIEIVTLAPEKSTFISKSSYLAEGWLENKRKWNWEDRQHPACHDIRGHLGAVLSIVYNQPIGTYTITETKCRAKGDTVCEFIGEVIR
ncbi:MAG: 4-vinyl reductase [candidate division KSB1 bacterium]|nr:4-vinyl reductase [candidate division KSB1 bacterium]